MLMKYLYLIKNKYIDRLCPKPTKTPDPNKNSQLPKTPNPDKNSQPPKTFGGYAITPF
jgi:hypothetical protein